MNTAANMHQSGRFLAKNTNTNFFAGSLEGIVPLFLTSKTQEIFHCIIAEDIMEERPYMFIKKEDIIRDMNERQAISDFHPIKQTILDYPEEEILLVYDKDFSHGQNFYIAASEAMKLKTIKMLDQKTEEEEEAYVTKFSDFKPWVSLGSGIEIEHEMVKESETKLKFRISRIRKEFGSKVLFTDRSASAAKDSYVECASYPDSSFSLKMMERDVGVQAVAQLQETNTQTKWTYPRNACTQSVAREFTEEGKKEHLESKDFKDFINSVSLRFEIALQQNEIMDVFYNDWKGLSDEEATFGGKADSHLKEYQSFTDIRHSKGKRISHIEWHPIFTGIVAVSIVENISMEDKINLNMKPFADASYILFWNFNDPINPQVILECPEDIYSFQFCPTDPNVIAGGCKNGQVVLWDISLFQDKLHNNRAGGKTDVKANLLPDLDEAQMEELPVVRYCAVSAIEYSHSFAITDLCWLPNHFEVTRLGTPSESKDRICVQLITCSPDCNVLFWDVRHPKVLARSMLDKRKGDEKELENPDGIPDTFKHLDLCWSPLLSMTLPRIANIGEYSPLKISIGENIKEKVHVDKPTHGKVFNISVLDYSSLRVPSIRNLKTLDNINTFSFIGTEDGEIVYTDWRVEKDSDTGKLISPSPSHCFSVHDGPVEIVQRSPFFNDIILSVGGWTFAIWKEGVFIGPLFHSACSLKRCTSGHWSLSRPGVFLIGKENGNIEVWDLLEKTHEPSQIQNISSAPITCIKPSIFSPKQHFLAVSDGAGTLLILEVPWTIRHSSNHEKANIQNYFEREVKRLEYFAARKKTRVKEPVEEPETKEPVSAAEKLEEIKEFQKAYEAYLELEKQILMELKKEKILDTVTEK
uniref:Dynein axonemal intermediate chain 3 n=1 Tax=Callorhinchus milii TaxID=7868 RepID=A0A4W3HJW7_CALMI